MAALEYARGNTAILIVNDSARPFSELYDPSGQRLRQKWLDLVFELGLRAQLPIPFDIQTIRVEDDCLIVVTEANTKVQLGFTKLVVFDFEKVVGANIQENILDYKVYDLFDISRGSLIKESQEIEREGNFVSRAIFYPSKRVLHNSKGHYKDIWVESTVAAEDLEAFDFSSTVVKLLLEREIKRHKITSDSGLSLKIEHSHRLVYKNRVEYDTIHSAAAGINIGHHLVNA